MNTAVLLDELKSRGVAISVDGGNLRLRGVEGSWDDLRCRLRAAKAELISVLQPQWDAEDWDHFFNERAAIAEYDGGLSRPDAERLAHFHCHVERSNRNLPPIAE